MVGGPHEASTLERIRRYLVGLRMPRSLEALDATPNRSKQGDRLMLEVLETLLGEAFTTRETRRVRMVLQTARPGMIKTLAGYDSSFQASLDRDRIMTLAQLEFIERRHAVHFLGPPGTGKSHLSIALGVEAVPRRQERLLQVTHRKRWPRGRHGSARLDRR
jgi:DNA replication protein DnaC